jgi:hypothetical protein
MLVLVNKMKTQFHQKTNEINDKVDKEERET